MGNATSKVNKALVRWTDEHMKRSAATLASETTFYTGAMIGITTAGYYAKFDDAQSMIFAGLVRGDQGNPVLPAGTAGDGTIDLDVARPRYFELAISSVAVTDIGKPVYAVDDQTGTLDPTTRTYGNLIGMVVDVAASGIALVEPAYDGVAGNLRLRAARYFDAAANVTISKWDINKTILANNTANITANLPAIANCPAGSQLTVLKVNSNANAFTLDGNSSETIDGATTLATIDAQYDAAILVSTGTAWIVAARDIA